MIVSVPHANDVTTFASKLSPHQKVAQCEEEPETGQDQIRSRSRDGAGAETEHYRGTTQH